MLKEIKKCIAIIFIEWAFVICPEGVFKEKLARFLHDNIMDL